jgi:excisionase family DNA binding protein
MIGARAPAPRRRRATEWVGLGEASRLLGVHPDTVRRWANAGKIDVFATQGGHRRFRRATIEALVPSPPRSARARSISGMGATVDRLAEDLRRRVRSTLPKSGRWSRHLEDADRAAFREHGRRASGLLLRFLDTTRKADRDQILPRISDVGRAYGRAADAAGMSLGEATAAFLFFRAQFMSGLAGVAERRGLSAGRAATLFEDADRALDRMLLALIAAHQAAGRRAE